MFSKLTYMSKIHDNAAWFDIARYDPNAQYKVSYMLSSYGVCLQFCETG